MTSNMKLALPILAVLAVLIFAGRASAQTLGNTNQLGQAATSQAIISPGAFTYVAPSQLPFTAATLDQHSYTNQSAQAASSFATPAVVGSCQTAGRGFSLQSVPGGINYAGPGSTEPICGGINRATLLTQVQRAEAIAALSNASIAAIAEAVVLKVSACAIDDVADIYETANAIDARVKVCPDTVKRADRSSREAARAQAALEDRPLSGMGFDPIIAASGRTYPSRGQ